MKLSLTKKQSKTSQDSLPNKRKCANTKIDTINTKKTKLARPSLAETGWEKLEIEAEFTYKKSRLDKPELIFVEKVHLLNHLDKGYGLFAACDIPKKTLVGEYTGEIMKKVDPDSLYSMEIKSNLYCDPTHTGNFTRFTNYSEHQENVEFIQRKEKKRAFIGLASMRNIKKGEQLLVNYNRFNEEAATKYYFLNSDDSWKSSAEYLEEKKTDFTLSTIHKPLPGLGLQKGDDVYLTKQGLSLINGEKLTNRQPQTNTLNLKYLKANQPNPTPLEFTEFDTINALITACYFGQSDNVHWLLKNNVELNKQQTISGRSALFFPFQGLKDGHCTEENCLKVVQSLIKGGANLFIQDNKSQLFLYSAIKYLSSDSFKTIFDTILKNHSFKEICQYINEKNEDMFIFAIKHKRVDMLTVLLEYSPNYLEKSIGTKKYYTIPQLKDLIKNYSKTELAQLKKIFSQKELSAKTMDALFNKDVQKPKNQHLKLFDKKRDIKTISKPYTRSNNKLCK